MNRRPQLLWLLVLLGALAAAAAPSTEDGARPTASWDRYRVLSDRNMFLRDRWRRPVASRPAIVVDTDRYLVLTGIGQEGPDTVAFIEDTRAGRTLRARTSDAVGKGRLVRICLDYVEYERGGGTARIGLGTSLAGSAALSVTTQVATSTQPAAGVGAGRAGEASAAEAAIAERMRLRRQQEIGR